MKPFVICALLLFYLVVIANCQLPTTAEIFIFPFVKLSIYVFTYLQQHRQIFTSSTPGNGNYIFNFLQNLARPENNVLILRNGIYSFINVTRDREDAEQETKVPKDIGYVDYQGQNQPFKANEIECLFLQNIFRQLRQRVGLSFDLLTARTYPDYVTEETKSRFMIYNERNQLVNVITYGNSQQLASVRIRKNSRLYVIAHGMFEGPSASWIQDLKNLIWRKTNRRPKPSFIIVDWRARALNFFVNRVAANSKVTGYELHDFLYELVKRNIVHMNNAHFIGFTYGAQVVGIAGYRFSEKKLGSMLANGSILLVEKITGLTTADDCYSPNLEKEDDSDGIVVTIISEKLSPVSALQVTAIHTSARFFGSHHRIGNIDVYIQGLSQPGCINRLEAVFNLFSGYTGELCNIFHSLELITRDYTIPEAKGCQPIAYRCLSYRDYQNGKCLSCDELGCQLAGIPIQIGEDEQEILRPAPNVFRDDREFRKNYYIATHVEDPYCAFNYKIRVFSDANPGNVGMWLELYDEDDVLYKLPLSLDISSSTLLTIPTHLTKRNGPVRLVRGHLKYINTPLYAAVLGDPFAFLVMSVQLEYTSNFDRKVREKYSTMLCADNERTVIREIPGTEILKNLTQRIPFPFVPEFRFFFPRFVVDVPLDVNYDVETCQSHKFTLN